MASTTTCGQIFFGNQGDTRWNQRRLVSAHNTFEHHEIDIRDRVNVLSCLREIRPDMIVHAAAQPSDDFDVNAVGTQRSSGATWIVGDGYTLQVPLQSQDC